MTQHEAQVLAPDGLATYRGGERLAVIAETSLYERQTHLQVGHLRVRGAEHLQSNRERPLEMLACFLGGATRRRELAGERHHGREVWRVPVVGPLPDLKRARGQRLCATALFQL